MTEFERNEIEKLPYKYRPMSAWGYFGYSLLFLIPVVGFIFLLVFSFSDVNINRRCFASSYFCAVIVLCVALAIFIGFGILLAVCQ